jgi:hypothetical protein
MNENTTFEEGRIRNMVTTSSPRQPAELERREPLATAGQSDVKSPYFSKAEALVKVSSQMRAAVVQLSHITEGKAAVSARAGANGEAIHKCLGEVERELGRMEQLARQLADRTP